MAGGANDLIWPAVDAYGTPDLKAELKPQVADGTARFVLGYSEPDGGSDIANAKTRAERTAMSGSSTARRSSPPAPRTARTSS